MADVAIRWELLWNSCNEIFSIWGSTSAKKQNCNWVGIVSRFFKCNSIIENVIVTVAAQMNKKWVWWWKLKTSSLLETHKSVFTDSDTMSGVWSRRLNSYLICRTNLICRFVRCPACHGVSYRKDEANSMPERTAGRDNWSKIWNSVVSTNVPCRHSKVCRLLRCYLLSESDANRIIIYSCVALNPTLT